MSEGLLEQLRAALGTGYAIERELGGGGMSRVFLATETALGRRVVVKVLPPDLAAGLSAERFRREIQVAAQFQNPHIVPLLNAGEAGGLLYYTMPYVEGESLRARLVRDGELPVAAAVQVMRDVAKALAYAHKRGVVHRDIKPENILLSEGEALVADFGVAKALSASTTSGGGLTSVGLALGTPAYMAPEQAVGDAGVDARADLYALGAVGYEMLTGSALFPGRSPQALVAAHATEAPERIERRRPQMPPALAAVIMRLLEKRASDRPQSAEEVLHELETVTLSGGTGIGLARSAGPGARRQPARLLAIGTGVLAMAVIIASIVVSGRRAPAPVASHPMPSQASVAVLPFVNTSGDKQNQYFSDGLTDELIDRLANVRGLRVVARTSSFAIKPGLDAPEIGRKLHVRNIVEGSVRRSGSHIRVSAQLIDADSGFNRWSHTYDGNIKDVFAVQQQIGTAIASELRVELAGRDSTALARTPTSDTIAHRLYLQGLFLWNQRTGASLLKAAELFKQAIARDPNYADAYSGLSQTYTLYPSYLDGPMQPPLDTADQMARKALALDSTMSGPHAAMGSTAAGRWRFAQADSEFDHAIALRPTDATSHHWRAYQLCTRGRFDAAFADFRIAEELDPLSMIIRHDQAACMVFARDFVSARRSVDAALELDPAFPENWMLLGEIHLWQGRADSGVAAMQHALTLTRGQLYGGHLALLAVAYLRAGERDSARRVFANLEAKARASGPAFGPRGVMATYLVSVDSGFALLRRGVDGYDGFLSDYFPGDPVFDTLRTDPRFAELKRLANMP